MNCLDHVSHIGTPAFSFATAVQKPYTPPISCCSEHCFLMQMRVADRYPLSLGVNLYQLSVFIDTELLPWVQKKRDADADTNGAAEPQPKKKKKKAAADTVADTADTLAAIAAAPLPVQVHLATSPDFSFQSETALS